MTESGASQAGAAWCAGTGSQATEGPNGIGQQCPECGMLTLPYQNGTVRRHRPIAPPPWKCQAGAAAPDVERLIDIPEQTIDTAPPQYDNSHADAWAAGWNACLSAAHTREAKRVFEAVVYAFEGKPVPEDLVEHGMVRRARKHREQAHTREAAIHQAVQQAYALLDPEAHPAVSADLFAWIEDCDNRFCSRLSEAEAREAALRAENETLRCERDAANAHARENSLEERDLRAHVARLEAALREIGDWPPFNEPLAARLQKIAKAALAASSHTQD